jgi:hypothetical protein
MPTGANYLIDHSISDLPILRRNSLQLSLIIMHVHLLSIKGRKLHLLDEIGWSNPYIMSPDL